MIKSRRQISLCAVVCCASMTVNHFTLSRAPPYKHGCLVFCTKIEAYSLFPSPFPTVVYTTLFLWFPPPAFDQNVCPMGSLEAERFYYVTEPHSALLNVLNSHSCKKKHICSLGPIGYRMRRVFRWLPVGIPWLSELTVGLNAKDQIGCVNNYVEYITKFYFSFMWTSVQQVDSCKQVNRNSLHGSVNKHDAQFFSVCPENPKTVESGCCLF